MRRTPLTERGAQNLRTELHALKTEKRPEVVKAIAEARAHGDLKENAEYHAAKEQQGFIEGRIAELEEQLSTAEIIDVTKLPPTGRVVFGATVEVANLESDESTTYRIVGELEADVRAGLVSVASPIARALIGKEEGDVVTVIAPSGEIEYEILSVAYI